jgi:hypothetical protein
MSTLRIFTIVVILNASCLTALADDTTQPGKQSATDKLPAEGMELPGLPTGTDIAVSPNGRYVIFRRPRDGAGPTSLILADVRSGDTFDLATLVPSAGTDDSPSFHAWPIGIDDTHVVIAFRRFDTSSSGMFVVDLKTKKQVAVPDPEPFQNREVYFATKVGQRWYISAEDRTGNAIIAVDLRKDTQQVLPYKGVCIGVFADGDVLLLGHADDPKAALPRGEMKKKAALYRVASEGTAPKLVLISALPNGHICFSSDGKYMATTTRDGENGTGPVVLQLFDLLQQPGEPQLVREQKLPGLQIGWLPWAVSPRGRVLWMRLDVATGPPVKEAAVVPVDGAPVKLSGNIIGGDESPARGLVASQRVWFVEAGEDDKPPTLRSIKVEDVDDVEGAGNAAGAEGQPEPGEKVGDS